MSQKIASPILTNTWNKKFWKKCHEKNIKIYFFCPSRMWDIVVSLSLMEAIMTRFETIKDVPASIDENETLIKLVTKFIPDKINSKYLHTQRDLQTQRK